jgi:membrane protease YdiL (CAAX protease family)
MKEKKSPLLFTLVVWVIWLVITLGGEILQAGGTTDLGDVATSSIIYSVIAAVVFLLIVVAYKKWWSEVGLKGPDKPRTLRLLWLPVLLILILAIAGFTSGVASDVILIVLINTMFVGISEELMMRGVLLHGFSFGRSAVSAVLIVAVLFGAMHALNGFLTGEFAPALFQALMATGFGVWIGALRIRLNTVIPLMILHWFWDFGVFASGAGQPSPLVALLPMLFAVIMFLYGIYLLRGYKAPEPVAETAAE